MNQQRPFPFSDLQKENFPNFDDCFQSDVNGLNCSMFSIETRAAMYRHNREINKHGLDDSRRKNQRDVDECDKDWSIYLKDDENSSFVKRLFDSPSKTSSKSRSPFRIDSNKDDFFDDPQRTAHLMTPKRDVDIFPNGQEEVTVRGRNYGALLSEDFEESATGEKLADEESDHSQCMADKFEEAAENFSGDELSNIGSLTSEIANSYFSQASIKSSFSGRGKQSFSNGTVVSDCSNALECYSRRQRDGGMNQSIRSEIKESHDPFILSESMIQGKENQSGLDLSIDFGESFVMTPSRSKKFAAIPFLQSNMKNYPYLHPKNTMSPETVRSLALSPINKMSSEHGALDQKVTGNTTEWISTPRRGHTMSPSEVGTSILSPPPMQRQKSIKSHLSRIESMNDSYQENSVTTSMSDPGSTCCNPDAKNYDGPLHDKVKEIFLNQNDSVSIDSTTMKNLLLSVKKAIKDSDSNNLNLFKKNGNDVELKICLPSQSSEYPEVFINVPSDINQTDSTMNSTANSQSTLHIDEGTQQVHEQAPWYRGSKILEKRSGPETEESVSYFTKVDQRKSSLFNIFRSAMGGHCCGGDISDV